MHEHVRGHDACECMCVSECMWIYLRMVGIQGQDERRGQASALEVGTAQSRAGTWLFLSKSCSLCSKLCFWNRLCGGVAAAQVTPVTLCSTSCHQSTSHL